MGFDAKYLGRLWLAVLLWAGIAVAADGEHQVTILVNNSAGISTTVLRQAEVEAERVLSAAGIDVQWVNCQDESSAGDSCRRIPGLNQFVLHIVREGKTSSESIFGEAFLGEDGSGKYCDIFLSRIEGAYRDAGTNIAQLLGAVAAHELGHLLLGSHSHSARGIMEPVWRSESLRQIGMGTLFFTREQSRLMQSRIMRSRIGAETTKATLLGSYRKTADDSYSLRKKEAFWGGAFAKGYGSDPSLRGRTP